MKESLFVGKIIDKYIRDEELFELLITHSRCVAEKALRVAEERGLSDKIDRQFVYDAAMLHDIGVVECNAPAIFCYGDLPYICHGIAGERILKKEGIGEAYGRVCSRHTGSGLTAKEIEDNGLPLPHIDLIPETLEEKLICFADKFFSKSRDPEKEKSIERVETSMMKFGDGAYKRFLELKTLFN